MKEFEFKKSLGQNFLQDENIIHKIVDSANLDKETLVIEIGPGGGAITKLLVPQSKMALLYEADTRLEAPLNKLLKNNDNYQIILGDFLKTNLAHDLQFYNYSKLSVVANLPYYITTPIIMKFIDENILPDQMIIMVQKEVASRLAATTGSRDYSSLTVLLNYYYHIEKLFDVSRNCFIPKPNVESTVVRMRLKEKLLPISDYDLFKKIVRDSFLHKRKTLRNNLKQYDLQIIEEVLKKYNFNLNTRAEALKLEIFIDLTNQLSKKNI